MDTTTQANIGFIPEYHVSVLEAGLSKIAKHASKLGVEPIRYTLTGKEETRCTKVRKNALDEEVREYTRFVEIEIHGSIPRLPGGWELLAVINHEDGMPIVRAVPGHELPAGQRNRGDLCDHCQTARKRNDTFVLRAEDGRVVQVGRNCLAEFLGLSAYAPEALLSFLQALGGGFIARYGEIADEDYASFDEYARRARVMIDVLSVVLASAAVVDELGWVSRKVAQANMFKKATADHVQFILWPPKYPTREDQEDLAKFRARMTDALRAEAKEAIEWAKSHLGAANDYLNNIATCASLESVGAANLGIVVSIFAMFRRHKDQLREQAPKVARVSEFVGEVKQRAEYELTLLSKPRGFEGSFATTYLTEFSDAAGHVFVWWASRNVTDGDNGWKVDETRKVKATIKKHEDYKGMKRTVLTRVTETK